MNCAIGIDIGGTFIKGALYDVENGECLHAVAIPTRDGEPVEGMPAFAAGVLELAGNLEQHAGISALPVGISAPGLTSRDGTHITFMPGRMNGLAGFDWPEFMQRETKVINDAHAALLGEIWQGAAKGARDVVLLTLGTGVGGAVVSDGHLLRGHIGRAGHLGHITVNHLGAPDIVNTPGSLEDAIGNATIAQRSGGKFQMTHELIDAVQTGDAFANEIWDLSVRALAAGMASLINCFDPEVIILGGGIAAGARDVLLKPLEHWLDQFEWRPGGHRVKIVIAELGEWAGACGAAWHVSKLNHAV